jgi:hypothetical protein
MEKVGFLPAAGKFRFILTTNGKKDKGFSEAEINNFSLTA